MKKILFFLGASGNLGKTILSDFENSDFDHIYHIGRRMDEYTSEKTTVINLNNATDELEVKKLFEKISFDSNDKLFLISTIGGFMGGKSIDETRYDEWQKMIDLNLNSAFLVSKYFIKIIKAAHSGSICFISAMSSLKPESNKAAYNISKNGLNFLIKTLAIEGKEYKMSANGIAPYIIDSEENQKWVKDLDDLVHPSDIGRLIIQIFGNYSFINGNVFVLPGTINLEEVEIK